MMTKLNNDHAKSALTEQEILSVERNDVPDTTDLQQKILMMSAELPQRQQLERVNNWHWRSFISFFTIKPYVTGLVSVLAAAVLVIGVLPDHRPTQPLPNTLAVDAVTQDAQQLLYELEWQDLMLMQDELAFASF